MKSRWAGAAAATPTPDPAGLRRGSLISGIFCPMTHSLRGLGPNSGPHLGGRSAYLERRVCAICAGNSQQLPFSLSLFSFSRLPP